MSLLVAPGAEVAGGHFSPGRLLAVAALLAGLDLAGAALAQRWSDTGHGIFLVAGSVTFVALFWFYAHSLRYAELAVVTLVWIVLLQAGVLGLAHLQGSPLSSRKWVAVAVIFVLTAYVILTPDVPETRGRHVSPMAGERR